MARQEPAALDMTRFKPFYEGIDESKLANVTLRLEHGRTMTTRQHNRRTTLLTRVSKAAEQIGALPGNGESLHCVLRGDFSLWDYVPAMHRLAGQAIDELLIVTLGFSKYNVTALGEMIDRGEVRKVEILCSHYFSAQDAPIYEQAVELFQKHGFRIAAMRSHSKMLLLAIGKNRYVVESSANLRSCHNVEQATVYNDPTLFEFHREWIDELLTKGAEQ